MIEVLDEDSGIKFFEAYAFYSSIDLTQQCLNDLTMLYKRIITVQRHNRYDFKTSYITLISV